jgi:hypothetical protein
MFDCGINGLRTYATVDGHSRVTVELNMATNWPGGDVFVQCYKDKTDFYDAPPTTLGATLLATKVGSVG